jgi:glutamyl-Q tRNA(Asp) synthetase
LQALRSRKPMSTSDPTAAPAPPDPDAGRSRRSLAAARPVADSTKAIERVATQPVRGRFAPSPTGQLHFGSLVAAAASFLDARSRGGEWLVRIEDLDPPREVPGAADAILRTLAACGLDWDGEVIYQSTRRERYAAALERLASAGLAYGCACTRSEIATLARTGIDGPVYPGLCRNGIAAGRTARSWRLRVPAGPIEVRDDCFGTLAQDVAQEVGDFVLRRADGWFAYQLAVVVDDAAQGITRVVRGADLLDSTQRQVLLQRLLGLATPAYLHVPAAVGAAGAKLSKQTFARPIERAQAAPALVAALDFLGQAPPAELEDERVPAIVDWAIAHWRPGAIPCRRTQPAPVRFS